jgi:hypothetical protein
VKGEDVNEVCTFIVFVIEIVLVVDKIPIEIVLVIGIIIDFKLGVFLIILVIMFIEIVFAFSRGESL